MRSCGECRWWEKFDIVQDKRCTFVIPWPAAMTGKPDNYRIPMQPTEGRDCVTFEKRTINENTY